MKRVINRKLIYAFLSLSVALILCFVVSFSQNKAFANQNKYGNYVPGKAIVCVDGGANALNTSNSANTLGSFTVSDSLMTLDSSREVQELIGAYSSNLKNQLYNIEPQYAYNNSSKKCEILLVDCEDTEKFVENASKVNCILWAQPDYIMQTNEIKDAEKIDEAPANTTPDPNLDTDPLFKYQWAYDGNNIGSASTNIGALDTWKAEESEVGDFSTVVAVIDTGVDYEHPDLFENMWSDGNNIPALTALGGGQYGLDTVDGEDSTDPMDRDNGHGTHCASSIASPFNGKGIMGVNGKYAKIMACRFMSNSYGSLSGAVKCFNYIITAKKNGVNVSCINNSWGDSNYMSMPNYALESVTNEAGLNGIISCFSSGNDEYDLDNFPYRSFCNPYTIDVSACDNYGNIANYSNYGEHSVDVFAPGTQMLNCVTRHPDSQLSVAQYISWLNPAVDSYFREDFQSESPKISLSSHKVEAPEEVVQGTYDAQEKCVTVDLSSYNVGDTIHIQMDMNKSDLAELIASQQSPYMSFLYWMQNFEIDYNMFGIRYISDTGEPALYDNWILRYNHNQDISAQKLMKNGFYNVTREKVSLEVECTISSKGNNPRFNLYDFGFGKQTGIYAYGSGTSAACPIVSGIISHVYPRLNASNSQDAKKVIAYVKGSTVDNASLSDKSINPGVVNLKNAYDGVNDDVTSIHPVVESIETNRNANGNINARLQGYFFGQSKGSLDYDGTIIPAENITSWTDTEINFIISNSIEHLAKFTVQRTDNQTGRNYFLVGTEPGDYIDLPVSDIQYNIGDATFKASDCNILRCATTKNSLYCLYGANFGVGSALMVMEKYDFSSGKWTSIDLSGLNINKCESYYYYSMASGKDEIYFLYWNNEGSFNLATYSEAINSFISDVCIDYAHFGDMIGNVNGELILCGRAEYVDKNRESDIVKVYPDTGKVYEDLGDFPNFSVNYNDVACGNISVYQNKIYIADSLSLLGIFEDGSVAGAYFGGPVIFDGENWIQGNEDMYWEIQGQTQWTASYATSEGLISQGIQASINNNSQKDTWTYNSSNNQWSLTNYKFSDVKNRSVAGICKDNNFYVLAQRSLVGDVAFRYLPLQKLGVESQNVTANVAKEINPEPEPEPVPVPIFIDSSAATGDSLNNIICLAIILFMSSFLICYLRKSRVKL